MSSLEEAEQVAWQRLDRRTVAVTALVMLGVAFGAGVPTTIGIAGGAGIGTALAWVLPCAALLIIGGAVVELLRWRATRYRVTDDRLELRFELVVNSRRTLRRERVRTVDVTANPLFRLFGLAELTAGTGQGSGSEDRVKLAPLPRAEADRLRQELLRSTATGSADSAGSAGSVGSVGSGPLATLDWNWIRYAPVSALAPALGAAAGGAVMQVSDWFGLQQQVIQYFIGLFRGLPLLIAILILAAAGMVIGMVGSLGLWVELWWNYRLEREPGGTLRVRRGLLTTRSVSIEEHRMRGVDLVEPLGNRLLGAGRVDAIATGMRERKQNERTDYRTLLPAAPRPVADRVAADVLREPVAPTSSVRLVGHPVAARGRRLRWAVGSALAFCAVPAVLGVLLTPVLLQLAAILAVVLLPVAVALALDAYRNLGHGITGDYLVTRSGAVRRSTAALQRSGVIGWTLRQSLFQRRSGLLTLTATTAAAWGAYTVLDAGEQDGLLFAEAAVPGLLDEFLER